MPRPLPLFRHIELGRLVEMFAEIAPLAVLHRDADGGEWVLEWTDKDGRRRSACQETLLTLYQEACGELARKQCSHCKEEKVVTAFSRDENKKDGRCGRCKICERERVRKYGRRTRAARKKNSGSPHQVDEPAKRCVEA